jgi:Ca2+-binding EF-hand superfamily protein
MNNEELQARFSAFDPEETGIITLESFRRILKEYAKEYNVILQIQEVAANQDILISFKQFQDFMLRNISESPPVYYHPDGSINWVSTFDFQEQASEDSTTTTLPEQDVSEETVQELLRQLDCEDEEQISFATFLKHHKPNKDAFRTIDLKI